MEWIHEGAEEFSVMVADNRKSRSSSRRLRSCDPVGPLILFILKSLHFSHVHFSLVQGWQIPALNKMNSVFLIWLNNGNYFARLHW